MSMAIARVGSASPPQPSPLSAARGGREQEVARDFEALFIAQLLKAARSAHLADDPLAPDDTAFRDAQDRDLAQRLATAAPLGVAKLLK